MSAVHSQRTYLYRGYTYKVWYNASDKVWYWRVNVTGQQGREKSGELVVQAARRLIQSLS